MVQEEFKMVGPQEACGGELQFRYQEGLHGGDSICSEALKDGVGNTGL